MATFGNLLHLMTTFAASAATAVAVAVANSFAVAVAVAFFFLLFSCPDFRLRQLYTYPCHSLTD